MKTVLFIGSGSTVSLKMPTTKDHFDLFEDITKTDNKYPNLLKLHKIIKILFKDNYSINDIFNLLDSNILLSTGLYASKDNFIAFDDLLKTKKELISYILNCFLKKITSRDDKQYYLLVDFYYQLAKKELNKKINYEGDKEKLDFIVTSYSTINLNYDLYSIMPFMEAHYKLNEEYNYAFSEINNPYLKIFTDYNSEYAVGENNGSLWFPMNECSAAVLNRKTHNSNRRIILTRAFYPHGLMNLFRCPHCSRHSLYMGDLTLKSVEKKLHEEEIYTCPYCHSVIKKENVDVLMQSNFKTRNSFLEEVRLKMQIELQNADRIIFIGYSLPDDDVDFRSFFKSIASNKEIYVALYDKKYENDSGFKDPSHFVELNLEHRIEKERFESVFKNSKIKMNFQGFFSVMESILNLF